MAQTQYHCTAIHYLLRPCGGGISAATFEKSFALPFMPAKGTNLVSLFPDDYPGEEWGGDGPTFSEVEQVDYNVRTGLIRVFTEYDRPDDWAEYQAMRQALLDDGWTIDREDDDIPAIATTDDE